MTPRTDIEDMTDAQDELSDAIGLILSATPEGEPWRASDFGTYPLDCTPTDTAIATILNAVVSGDLARPSQAGDERVARLIEAVRGLLHYEIAHVGPYAVLRVAEVRAALAAMDTPKGGGDADLA